MSVAKFGVDGMSHRPRQAHVYGCEAGTEDGWQRRHAGGPDISDSESVMRQDRPMAGKPGRPSKGDRTAKTVRIPDHHLPKYQAIAQQLDMPLGDYVALKLAEAHNYDVPDYLVPADPDQFQLPVGA